MGAGEYDLKVGGVAKDAELEKGDRGGLLMLVKIIT